MAKVVLCRNPFRPQVERDLVTVRAGTRIDTMLRQQSLVKGRAGRLQRLSTFVVQVNGSYLLADQWARRIRNEDVVVVSLLPGDGGGGSNPLKMVLQVALIAAAVALPGMAPASWGLLNAAGGVSALGAMASAGIMIAGTMLLNLAFPSPKPNVMQAREQASPTHTLSAQGNMARLQEAIPVLYGRHMIFPDFAAQPYTETDSNNTYLYQLFCVGQGELDIERIRIEETPIENFAEVSWEVVRPGDLVTLFPDNVVTSSIVQGLELKGSNEDGAGWMGPYVTNPAGTRANVIGIDISLSQGLYYANDEGGLDGATVSWRIEARPINDAGAPAGEWTLLGKERWGEATATPQIKSFRYGVPDGRFEVRAMRVGTKNLDQRCANTVSWAGLRAYLPSTQSYGNVTLLAVAMRATNNLNQSTSRRINVIATRKLPVWDPVAGWSLDVRATRNPAWALADMLRSRVYGRGMLDTAYNLPELYRLAQVWEQRRDYYDDVIDTTMTLWDALSRAARVGRAVPMYYAGLIDFVRNEPRSIPRAMFTPDNIVDGSFSINYSFIEHDSPDHVVIEYVDSETWQPAEVACVLPGGTQERPARVQLPGVSNRDQAWREGMSMAAANRDQRIVPSLQTELDGHIPNFLDLVTVVHDTPKWGLSGFVTAWDPATRRLQVSEPLEWYQGQQHYISLRQRDGAPRGPFRVTAGRDELECVLVSPPADLYVSEGEIEEPTLYAFGPGERTGLKALVRRAVPDESGHVTLELVNYADSVHSAELGGEVPPPPPASLLPLTPDAPIVAEVTVYATANPGEQIASCTPARGATTYEFEASQDQGQSWTRLGADTIPSLTIRLTIGPWWVRARGVGKNPGPWKTWQGHISATMLPPPALLGLTASPLNFGIRLAWSWPSAIRLRYIEIWHSQTPDFLDAAPLGQFSFPQSSHEMSGLAAGRIFYFWARVRDEADQPGPWFPQSGDGVRGQSSADADDILELLGGQITAGQLAQELRQTIDLIGQIDELLGQMPDLVENVNSIPGLADGQQRLEQHIGQVQGRVDELNNQLDALMTQNDWDVGRAYATGDVVFYVGKMYRAKQPVPAGVAVADSAYWELIGDFASITGALSVLAVNVREVTTRVEQAEHGLEIESGRITALGGRLDNAETGLSALAQLTQSMTAQIRDLETGLSSTVSLLTAVTGRLEVVEQDSELHGQAISNLETVQEQQGDDLRSMSSSLTSVSASLRGAEDNEQALLETGLGAAEAELQAQDELKGVRDQIALTDRKLADKAEASAVSSLTGRVERHDNELLAHGQDLVELKASLGDLGDDLSTKATAEALQQTDALVRQQGNDIEALGAEQTRLSARVDDAEQGLETQAENLDQALSRVQATEEGQAATNSRLVSMSASIRAAEDNEQALLETALGAADAAMQGQDGLAERERQALAQARIQQQLTQEVSQTADETRSAARSILQLQNQVADPTTGLAAQAQAHQELSQEVVQVGENIHAVGRDVSALRVRVDDVETQQAAQADALDSVEIWAGLVDDRLVAQASSINGLTADVGNAQANVALVQNALAETNGKLSATGALKVEVSAGGKSYVAGMTTGVIVEPGKPVQSETLFLADRFAFLHLANGAIFTPFVIQGGQVFISQAFIGQSWIKSANIQSLDAYKIESQNLAAKLATIGTAYITSAHIHWAQIQSVHIVNASIDTLKIAGNAVTLHASRIGDGDLVINAPHGGVATIITFWEGFMYQGAAWPKNETIVSLNGGWVAQHSAASGSLDIAGQNSLRLAHPITGVVNVALGAGWNTINVRNTHNTSQNVGKTIVLFSMR